MRHSNILFAAALSMGLTPGLTVSPRHGRPKTITAQPPTNQVVTPIVAGRGYPVASSTGIVANCVRDNASAEELTALASRRDNIGWRFTGAVGLVHIMVRPETDAGFRGNGTRLG